MFTDVSAEREQSCKICSYLNLKINVWKNTFVQSKVLWIHPPHYMHQPLKYKKLEFYKTTSQSANILFWKKVSNFIYHIVTPRAPFEFPQNKSAHSVQPFGQIYNKRNFSWKRLSFRERKKKLPIFQLNLKMLVYWTNEVIKRVFKKPTVFPAKRTILLSERFCWTNDFTKWLVNKKMDKVNKNYR